MLPAMEILTVAGKAKQEFFVVSKTGKVSFWAIGKQEDGFFFFIRGSCEDGLMSRRMEAEDDFGPWGVVEAKALVSDRNPSVGADLQRASEAPNIRPPRATRGWADDRPLFLFGQVPGALRGQLKFAVSFVGVAMKSQSVDVSVSIFEFGDLFAGEIRWKAFLPELVLALDFAFGLGRWSIKEANVVELQGGAQLGESFWVLSEEDAVIIDIELEWASVGQEGGGEEIQVGQEKFAVIEFRTDEEAAAIVEHVEHREVDGAERKPTVRRGIQLPEFTNLRALPAPNRSVRFFRNSRMGIAVLHGPMADLGTVEFETVEEQGFGSGEAIGARRRAVQALFEKVNDGLRPRRGVVTAGATRSPEVRLFLSASMAVIAGQGIEAAGGDVQLVGGLSGRQRVLLEGLENMPDERRAMTME
jgi:hypothetical protein